jgi:hypothetical protein
VVTEPSGPTVTSPVQVAQPPLCGPPALSRAMFQLTALRAQLRVVPRTTLRACHVRVSRKTLAGGSCAPFEPEHSVNQIPLSGKASWSAVWALGSP